MKSYKTILSVLAFASLTVLALMPVLAQVEEYQASEERVNIIKIKNKDGETVEFNINGKDILGGLDLPENLEGFLNKQFNKVINKIDFSEEEKQRILDKLEEGIEIEIDHNDSNHYSGTDDRGIDIGEFILGIVAISFSLGMPVIIVALTLYYAAKKRKQKHELIEKMIESGQPLSEEILKSIEVKKNTPLESGLTSIGIGIALIVFLGLTAGWAVGAVGLIPLFIGIARIVSWKMET